MASHQCLAWECCLRVCIRIYLSCLEQDGAGLGRLCPGLVVWRQVGWPASVRDLWVVQALSAGLHLALKTETTDAATNLIYLCPKMHVIFHLPSPWGFPWGWARLSHSVPHLLPADTVRQPQCRSGSLLYPPHCWEQRNGSDGPDRSVWAKSHEWKREAASVEGISLGKARGPGHTQHRAPAPGFSAPFIKMCLLSPPFSSLNKSHFPVYSKQ